MPNCPYCGQKCENRRGLKSHSSQAHSRPPFDKDDLAGFLRELADELGEKPTIRDLPGTKYSRTDILKLFETWNEAVEYAGFEPNTSREPGLGRGHTGSVYGSLDGLKSAFKERVAEFVERNGHPPSRMDWAGLESTPCGSEIIRKRLFDSWNEAIRAAGFEPKVGAIDERFKEKNPRYKDGSSIGGVSYGRNWEEQRQRCLERDNYECRSCGLTQEEHKEKHGFGLDVHHVVPLRKFDDPKDANSLGNLVAACRTCHRQYEGLPVFPE